MSSCMKKHILPFHSKDCIDAIHCSWGFGNIMSITEKWGQGGQVGRPSDSLSFERGQSVLIVYRMPNVNGHVCAITDRN